MTKTITILFLTLLILAGIITHSHAEQQAELIPRAYLPLVMGPPEFQCAASSTNQYTSGTAFQFDTDNPVRPAYNHADKNIVLRSYTPNTDPNLKRELVDYGSGDGTQPPQFATLFSPYQVPPFAEFYRVYQWQWAASPNPGTRGGPITDYPTTAVSFTLPPGKTLHTPVSGYDIGGGMEVIVLFADADTITLHYTREDSAARGYTIHIDQICTDPNLLSLYNSLDGPNGPRYRYPSSGYNLPTLPAGKLFGTTSSQNMVVALADSGAFQDPRSCNEWWQSRPGYPTLCPPAWSILANGEE
ncbi:MAG: hypothetical protein IAF02_01405 [Anaerolineae bacterium]|nr:hypothetical protein [Anaerolineae bacterium]